MVLPLPVSSLNAEEFQLPHQENSAQNIDTIGYEH